MLLKPEGKKYVLVSQHWTSKIGKKVGDNFQYVNPISDEGKRQLTHLKDLETLIEFFGWSDSGVYYKFSEKESSSWGMETYEIADDGSLKFLNADYDTSD